MASKRSPQRSNKESLVSKTPLSCPESSSIKLRTFNALLENTQDLNDPKKTLSTVFPKVLTGRTQGISNTWVSSSYYLSSYLSYIPNKSGSSPMPRARLSIKSDRCQVAHQSDLLPSSRGNRLEMKSSPPLPTNLKPRHSFSSQQYPKSLESEPSSHVS
jgi:hypothetical protein